MIYYSHINEDNFAERKLIQSSGAEELICIAGSGERVIALLDLDTITRIHIVDINIEALYLIQLKLLALSRLDTETYLSFVGFTTEKINRRALYHKIKFDLQENCRFYWDKNIIYIEQGIASIGHFEKFLKRIRPILRTMLGKKFYQCFSRPASEIESFPSFRWKIVRELFGNRWIYQLLGNRDIAFIHPEAELKHIPNALDKTLENDMVSQNCLFHLVFNGHFYKMREKSIPPSLQNRILKKAKSNLNGNKLKIHYYHQDIVHFIKTFDFSTQMTRLISLSDLLSFMNHKELNQLLECIQDQSSSPTTTVIRAFVQNRFTEREITKLRNQFLHIMDCSHLDESLMYQVYQINFGV